MQQRLIFHVDVNSAFLSWEAARRVAAGEPDLRAIPSAIGGDRDKRTGIILAKSIPAKKIRRHHRRAGRHGAAQMPAARPRPAGFRPLYAQFPRLHRHLPPLRPRGGAGLDRRMLPRHDRHPPALPPTLSPSPTRSRTPFSPSSASPSTSASPKTSSCPKWPATLKSPIRSIPFFPAEIPQKLWPLPVGDLLSVGRALAEKLTAARIRTIGDLARTDLAYLQKLTGVRTAALLHDYACGVDPSPSSPSPRPSNATATPPPSSRTSPPSRRPIRSCSP